MGFLAALLEHQSSTCAFLTGVLEAPGPSTGPHITLYAAGKVHDNRREGKSGEGACVRVRV